MKKRDKISTVKDLLSDTKKEVLTASEIKFLKSRKVDTNLTYKVPLMIFSNDSAAIEKTIRGIALKLDCPVIKITKAKVSDRLPGIVTAPKEKEILLKQGREQRNPGFLGNQYKSADLSTIDKTPHNTQKEIAEEPEPELIESEQEVAEVKAMEVETIAEGIRSGNYKLSFRSVWEGINDDDDTDMDIKIKQRSDLRTF